MAENKVELRRRQLGVDGHSDKTAMPAREQHLHIGRAILHQQRHAIAGREAEAPAEGMGQGGDPIGESAVGRVLVGADGNRRPFRRRPSRAGQQIGDVHPLAPPRLKQYAIRRIEPDRTVFQRRKGSPAYSSRCIFSRRS